MKKLLLVLTMLFLLSGCEKELEQQEKITSNFINNNDFLEIKVDQEEEEKKKREDDFFSTIAENHFKE